MKIGLLSDTHSFLDPSLLELFEDRDEIWHGGDFGSQEVIDQLKAFKPLRGVFGNIDSQEIQRQFPLDLYWNIGAFKVHILKIIKDPIYNHLHINPGACGHEGFHAVRTATRFEIKDHKLIDLEIIELGPRGSLS